VLELFRYAPCPSSRGFLSRFIPLIPLISLAPSAGLFVELDETGADGLIPARLIGDEYFHFDEKGRAFTDRSATYRLGDPVTVDLVEAAPVAGALRFRLAHGGHADRAERTRHKPKEQRKIAPGKKPSKQRVKKR